MFLILISSSARESLEFSITPKEFEAILIILVSEIISVNENALLVKQVLLIVNGLILSGSSTTLETKDESVTPDR